MKAKLLFHEKVTFADGAIMEAVLWELPEKTLEEPHGFKYRLHYGFPGQTLVRYDNEKARAIISISETKRNLTHLQT